MKAFLAGVATTVVVLAAAVAVLLGTLDGRPSPRPSPPTISSTATTTAGGTELADVELRTGDLLTADGRLTDVIANGAGITVTEDGIRARSLTVEAVLPFATAAAQVGPDTRLYAAPSGRAGIERRVSLLGRDVRIVATGTVAAEGGDLLIEPETVDLGGPSWLDSAASALARTLVTIRQPVEGVPDGMTLEEVSVVADGFRVDLSGTNVTIGP